MAGATSTVLTTTVLNVDIEKTSFIRNISQEQVENNTYSLCVEFSKYPSSMQNLLSCVFAHKLPSIEQGSMTNSCFLLTDEHKERFYYADKWLTQAYLEPELQMVQQLDKMYTTLHRETQKRLHELFSSVAPKVYFNDWSYALQMLFEKWIQLRNTYLVYIEHFNHGTEKGKSLFSKLSEFHSTYLERHADEIEQEFWKEQCPTFEKFELWHPFMSLLWVHITKANVQLPYEFLTDFKSCAFQYAGPFHIESRFTTKLQEFKTFGSNKKKNVKRQLEQLVLLLNEAEESGAQESKISQLVHKLQQLQRLHVHALRIIESMAPLFQSQDIEEVNYILTQVIQPSVTFKQFFLLRKLDITTALNVKRANAADKILLPQAARTNVFEFLNFDVTSALIITNNPQQYRKYLPHLVHVCQQSQILSWFAQFSQPTRERQHKKVKVSLSNGMRSLRL